MQAIVPVIVRRLVPMARMRGGYSAFTSSRRYSFLRVRSKLGVLLTLLRSNSFYSLNLRILGKPSMT